MTERCFIPSVDQLQTDFSPFGTEASARANTIIRSLPGYAPTPLVDLSLQSKQVGVGNLFFKDEGNRFEVGSFKALGGAYGVYRAIEERLVNSDLLGVCDTGRALDGYGSSVGTLTVVCATDGNYGRAVAWAAKMFGCKCRVYVNSATSKNRERAIQQYGATVIRVPGIYEDALEQAAKDAQLNNWTIVSDTAYEGCNSSPENVMAGYATIVREIEHQWPCEKPPTHVFLQVGVGGLAASVITECLRVWPQQPPIFIAVEPVTADCAFQSGIAGVSTVAKGNLDTLCAGLACSQLSTLAWPVLKENVYAYLLIDDEEVAGAMRRLATLHTGAVISGESGCAGFAAFWQVCSSDALKQALNLGERSQVLAIGTEGATDPDIFRSIVGVEAPA